MKGTLRVDALVFGASLIALGILWTLSNLGRLDLLPALRRWWPLVLVVWGALELGVTLSDPARRRP